MATMREKQPGVWEVRVFTGTDARGRPTQMSKTIHGGKRDAERLAAEMEVGPGSASPAGRTVGDVLDACGSIRTSTRGRRRRRAISRVGCGRSSSTRLPRSRSRRCRSPTSSGGTRGCVDDGMHDAGIKNQHGVLRAALAQAVRWGWVGTNVASMAQLQVDEEAAGSLVMTLDDVRAVMAAAAEIDPAAALMLRIAAVSGARRAELARCGGPMSTRRDADDRLGDRGDPSSSGERARELNDAATEDRQHPDGDARPRHVERDRGAAVSAEPYGPWMFGLGSELVSPDRIGWWWKRARTLAGVDAALAAARPAPLVGHRLHRPGPRRPHRRRPPRPLQPGDDPARLRPRLRRRRPSPRRWPR